MHFFRTSLATATVPTRVS